MKPSFIERGREDLPKSARNGGRNGNDNRGGEGDLPKSARNGGNGRLRFLSAQTGSGDVNHFVPDVIFVFA